MQGPGERCVPSKRAIRLLQSPDKFLKYVLSRADASGFPVTPSRVQSIVASIKGVDISAVSDPFATYEEIFAAYLAQDSESRQRFHKFWRDLWYVCYGTSSLSSVSGRSPVDAVVDRAVNDLIRKMGGGMYRLPPKVIEE